MKKLDKSDQVYLKAYFEREVLPLISPQIIDKRHPFPFLKNKELYVGVRITGKSGNAVRLGIIPASGYFKRVIFMPGKGRGLRFLPVEELILHFAGKVFHQHQVTEKTLFRITRNADIDVEDEIVDVDLDYREAMEELLKKRRKLSPVRLELSSEISPELKEYFCRQLLLSEEQVFVDVSPLSYAFLSDLERRLKKQDELFYPPFTPQPHPLVGKNIPMSVQIARRDILLHYPYHSMEPLLRLLNESAYDEAVVSIKITLYRVAKDSKIVHALMNAAENGKEVHVMVELRARFDEESNIDWSRRLEEAGCHVIYGLPGYKVHSKLLLITRKVGNHIRYTTQIGTGNYNETTAKLYTDLALFTSDEEIAAEASAVFNSLCMGNVLHFSEHLLVAPYCFKNKINQMVDREIAYAVKQKPAQIMIKMNSLTDRELIDKLIEASCAGVKIRMLVRGICCLKPGIPGVTENISVISIVGRYLEHTRIFVFGCNDREQIYLSSADFMTRNTSRRVEVAAPIRDRRIGQEIIQILNIMLSDNQKAREQQPDGTYIRVENNKAPVNAQEVLCAKAKEQAVISHPEEPEKGVSRKLFDRVKGFLKELTKERE